jgi:hypothetical protein
VAILLASQLAVLQLEWAIIAAVAFSLARALASI